MIYLISLLSGLLTVIVVRHILAALSQFEFERGLRDRYDGARRIYGNGVKRGLLALAAKTGETLKSRIRVRWVEQMTQQTGQYLRILGGEYASIDPCTIAGIQVLGALAAIPLGGVLLTPNPLLLLGGAAGTFALPYFWLKEQAQTKHRKIFRQLPDVLDMLTLMLEAGLDFSSALNKIIAAEKGELIDELRGVQQEIQLGRSRAAALESLDERLHSAPLSSVLATIMAALKSGGNLAPALRILSDQFRTERALAAEKAAGEAPVKMLGPLVILIFPTIFIIIFGPILLSFIGYQ